MKPIVIHDLKTHKQENENLYKFINPMNRETTKKRNLCLEVLRLRSRCFINMEFKEGTRVCGTDDGNILFFTDKKIRLIKAFGKKVINFYFGGLKWR